MTKTNLREFLKLYFSTRRRCCSSLHLLQDVGADFLGISQLILPLLRDEGFTVRSTGPQQASQCCTSVTVLPCDEQRQERANMDKKRTLLK